MRVFDFVERTSARRIAVNDDVPVAETPMREFCTAPRDVEAEETTVYTTAMLLRRWSISALLTLAAAASMAFISAD